MEERRGCLACTHTSICWVDGPIGFGILSIHKHSPNEELVGHLEDQLIYCLFHLGRKVSQALDIMWTLQKWALVTGSNSHRDKENTDG